MKLPTIPRIAWICSAIAAALATALTWYVTDMRGNVALLHCQRDASDQQRAALRDAHHQYVQQTEDLDRVSADFETARRALQTERTARERDKSLAIAAAAPSPAAGSTCPGLFSIAGLRDYNQSLGYANADATIAGQPAGETEQAARADAGLSRADLLEHARDYGAWCRLIEAQRDELVHAWGSLEAQP